MKSAEQWTSEIYSEPTSFVQSEIDRQTVAKIRAIQLDAMKEGARRVANKLRAAHKDCKCDLCQQTQWCENLVLTAAEQWTEANL